MTDAERLDKALDECQIPNHMRPGVRNYVLHRKRSGDFLMSVLENNLAQAAMRADTVNNQRNMICWSWLLHSGGIPSDAWGSKEKVDAWLAGTQWDPRKDQPVFGVIGGLDILHIMADTIDCDLGEAATTGIAMDHQDALCLRWAISELAKTFKDDGLDPDPEQK